MIDEATLDRFYGEVSPDLRRRFVGFLGSHDLATAEIDGVRVPYYACGEGAPALLTFCGGHSTPYTLWETIATFETDRRVLAIDVSGFTSVGAFSNGVNTILDREGVDRVVLSGASLGGLLAQIYLKHNPDRADGVILMQTLALKPRSDRPLSLALVRVLPEALLKWIFRKKIEGYFAQAMADPRAAERGRFGLAHFNEVMANHFTRRKLANLLSLLVEFGRAGFTRADFEGWRGRALIVGSEDDPGFDDVAWLVDAFPNAESHVFPTGLGHLPQLAHREKFDDLIRDFLARSG